MRLPAGQRPLREGGDRLLSGDRSSVSGVLVCWSLDLGSTPDGSLSFSFPLDHLGLCILTSTLIHLYQVIYLTGSSFILAWEYIASYA